MFFRSLGGSFGLAAFGTTLNATIRSEIPARTGVPADEAASLIRSPEEIAALPPTPRVPPSSTASPSASAGST